MIKKAIFTLWVLIGITMLFSYSKINGFKILPRTLVQVFPQGWGFFSKSPLDEELIIYRKREDKIYDKASYTQSDINCFLGLSKTKRLLDVEVTKMSQFVAKSSWKNIKLKELVSSPYSSSIELKEHLKVNALKNNYYTLPKGEYILIKQGIVPFEWSNSSQYLNQMVTIAKIKIDD